MAVLLSTFSSVSIFFRLRLKINEKGPALALRVFPAARDV